MSGTDGAGGTTVGSRSERGALVATVGAATAAWVQAKQYATLASAYAIAIAIANEELASIRVLSAHGTGEAAWAEFVDSAEGAISREHTMWRAPRTS